MKADHSVKIITEGVEVVVNNREERQITEPEMVSDAIIALLSCLDVKNFAENGVQDKFDICIERILDNVHSLCEWGGWTDKV